MNNIKSEQNIDSNHDYSDATKMGVTLFSNTRGGMVKSITMYIAINNIPPEYFLCI